MTLGTGDLEGRQLLGVRLLGERGLHLVEADLADVPAVDGASALSPLQAGWPGLAGGSISPTSLVPAAGASMSGAASHALVLRLHVDDPSTESSFDDVGIDYRSGLIRQERRLLYSLRLVPDTACR